MNKLKEWIDIWCEGGKVRGIDITPEGIYECIAACSALVNKEQHEFINSDVKMVLDKCGIKTEEVGIGWRLVY